MEATGGGPDGQVRARVLKVEPRLDARRLPGLGDFPDTVWKTGGLRQAGGVQFPDGGDFPDGVWKILRP